MVIPWRNWCSRVPCLRKAYMHCAMQRQQASKSHQAKQTDNQGSEVIQDYKKENLENLHHNSVTEPLC